MKTKWIKFKNLGIEVNFNQEQNGKRFDEIKKYVKERKKILEYLLGCDKKFSEQWGRYGEISFGNKIILCPDCAYEIVKKIGEE